MFTTIGPFTPEDVPVMPFTIIKRVSSAQIADDELTMHVRNNDFGRILGANVCRRGVALSGDQKTSRVKADT